MHAVDCAADHVLAGQPWHRTAPGVALNVLGAHGTQPDDRVPYVPAGHRAHVTLAVVLHAVLTYLPTEHVPHRLQAVELADTEKLTEGVHAPHVDRPAVCEYVPALQEEHAREVVIPEPDE